MLGLHVGHLHLGSCPETVDLPYIRYLEPAVQLVHLVVILHFDWYKAVLTYPRYLLGIDVATVFRRRLELPALVSVDGLFAEQLVRVFVHVAAAHIVVGEVAAHKIVGLCRRAADASCLLHRRQIEPFVVVLAYLVIVPCKEARTFDIARIAEKHHRFTVFFVLTHIDRVRDEFTLAYAASLVDEFHYHFRPTCVAVGTVFYLLGDVSPRLCLCSGCQCDEHRRGNCSDCCVHIIFMY